MAISASFVRITTAVLAVISITACSGGSEKPTDPTNENTVKSTTATEVQSSTPAEQTPNQTPPATTPQAPQTSDIQAPPTTPESPQSTAAQTPTVKPATAEAAAKLFTGKIGKYQLEAVPADKLSAENNAPATPEVDQPGCTPPAPPTNAVASVGTNLEDFSLLTIILVPGTEYNVQASKYAASCPNVTAKVADSQAIIKNEVLKAPAVAGVDGLMAVKQSVTSKGTVGEISTNVTMTVTQLIGAVEGYSVSASITAMSTIGSVDVDLDLVAKAMQAQVAKLKG